MSIKVTQMKLNFNSVGEPYIEKVENGLTNFRHPDSYINSKRSGHRGRASGLNAAYRKRDNILVEDKRNILEKINDFKKNEIEFYNRITSAERG